MFYNGCWVVIHSSNGKMPKSRLARAVNDLSEYYALQENLSATTSVQQTGWGGVISLHQNESNGPNRNIFNPDSEPFFYLQSAPFVSGLDCSNVAFARKLMHDPDLVSEVYPPYAGIYLDKSNQKAFVFNDCLGIAKIFRLKTEWGCVLSNRPLGAFIGAGVSPRIRHEAIIEHLIFGYHPFADSFFDGLELLEGGTQISLDSSESKTLHLNTYHGFFKGGVEIGDLTNSYKKYFDQCLSLDQKVNLDIALSGGRDSRVSAAIFSEAAGVRGSFRTNFPPNLEKMVAKDLVKRLEKSYGPMNVEEDRISNVRGDVIWKGSEKKFGDPEFRLTHRCNAWANHWEGVGLATMIMQDCKIPHPFFQGQASTLVVSGDGGELGKTYKWVAGEMDWGTAEKSFKTISVYERLIDYPLTNTDTFGLIDSGIENYFANKCFHYLKQVELNYGIQGYQLLSYWYLTKRIFRAQAQYMSGRTLNPFFHPRYMRYALSSDVKDKFSGRVNQSLVDHFRPEWTNMPYLDDLWRTTSAADRRNIPPQAYLWNETQRDELMEVLDEVGNLPYVNRDLIFKVIRSGNLPRSVHPVSFQQKLISLCLASGLLNCVRNVEKVLQNSEVNHIVLNNITSASYKIPRRSYFVQGRILRVKIVGKLRTYIKRALGKFKRLRKFVTR